MTNKYQSTPVLARILLYGSNKNLTKLAKYEMATNMIIWNRYLFLTYYAMIQVLCCLSILYRKQNFIHLQGWSLILGMKHMQDKMYLNTMKLDKIRTLLSSLSDEIGSIKPIIQFWIAKGDSFKYRLYLFRCGPHTTINLYYIII